MVWRYMNRPHPSKLSEKAMNELRTIVRKQIDDSMTDEEIEEMGFRVLRFVKLTMVPVTHPPQSR